MIRSGALAKSSVFIAAVEFNRVVLEFSAK